MGSVCGGGGSVRKSMRGEGSRTEHFPTGMNNELHLGTVILKRESAEFIVGSLKENRYA